MRRLGVRRAIPAVRWRPRAPVPDLQLDTIPLLLRKRLRGAQAVERRRRLTPHLAPAPAPAPVLAGSSTARAHVFQLVLPLEVVARA